MGILRSLLLATVLVVAGASHGAMADSPNGNGNGNSNGNGGGHGNNRGAPLPLAGVGLPILAAAGLYYVIRARRRD